ncbi:hypothetical protein EMPS_05613 [Entomortierella parvispora]|uniref:Uncharacterized protein n=1 Tax=Entomortierella parvispora TaxID=205924 RepID=A0A9P3LWX7_9FUNG|nr:hypothetical protein EMPS_05613 [Entomortierella parvispora]
MNNFSFGRTGQWSLLRPDMAPGTGLTFASMRPGKWPARIGDNSGQRPLLEVHSDLTLDPHLCLSMGPQKHAGCAENRTQQQPHAIRVPSLPWNIPLKEKLYPADYG